LLQVNLPQRGKIETKLLKLRSMGLGIISFEANLR
jgi:hypothetical protein